MKLAEAKKLGMNFYLFGGLAIYLGGRPIITYRSQLSTVNALVISLMSPPFLYENWFENEGINQPYAKRFFQHVPRCSSTLHE